MICSRIKNDPSCEKYLIDPDYKSRCTVAQFRSRSNFMPINHTKLPFVEDIDIVCPFCGSVCADESHFLMNCPFFYAYPVISLITSLYM